VEGDPPGPEAASVIYGREYRQWRIEHGVAEGPSEIPAGALSASTTDFDEGSDLCSCSTRHE